MSDPNQEEQLYALVATEMEGSDYHTGLWVKCFAEVRHPPHRQEVTPASVLEQAWREA